MKKPISRRNFLRFMGASALIAAGMTSGCGWNMNKNTLQSIGSFIFPEAGHLPTGERLRRIKSSPNYYNGQFQCLEPITDIMSRRKNQFMAMARFVFDRPAYLKPPTSVPAKKIKLEEKSCGDMIIWLGHSSAYFELAGRRILLDPVFREYASPVSFVNKAFSGTNPYAPKDFPSLDVILITHDHWDHLDCQTLKALEKKTAKIVCPLGVGSYLEEWGFAPGKIFEDDWGASLRLYNDLIVHIISGQHFSGRLLTRNQTEWAGFIIETPSRRVFISGDGGYGRHFAALGQKYGAFDLALIENGQYNEDWHRIHLMPEETAQAAIDLRAKVLLPVHNGKFALARHPWDEPMRRTAELAKDKPYHLVTPLIGAPLCLDDISTTETPRWWERM